MIVTFVDDSLKGECAKMSCSYGCKKTGNSYECFCKSGYILASDNESCEGMQQ